MRHSLLPSPLHSQWRSARNARHDFSITIESLQKSSPCRIRVTSPPVGTTDPETHTGQLEIGQPFLSGPEGGERSMTLLPDAVAHRLAHPTGWWGQRHLPCQRDARHSCPCPPPLWPPRGTAPAGWRHVRDSKGCCVMVPRWERREENWHSASVPETQEPGNTTTNNGPFFAEPNSQSPRFPFMISGYATLHSPFSVLTPSRLSQKNRENDRNCSTRTLAMTKC